MKLGKRVGLGPGHIVLDGDPALPPPKGHSHQFSVCICSRKMAEWIKMPLGMEVGLGPNHTVLDGDPTPPQKGGTAPWFLIHVCCGEAAVWIKMLLGAKVGLGPGHIVLHGDPAPHKRGPVHQFSGDVYYGQTIAHLDYCWALVFSLSQPNIINIPMCGAYEFL